jgi:hypothetical protein
VCGKGIEPKYKKSMNKLNIEKNKYYLCTKEKGKRRRGVKRGIHTTFLWYGSFSSKRISAIKLSISPDKAREGVSVGVDVDWMI